MRRLLFSVVYISIGLLLFAFRKQMITSIFDDQNYINKLREEYSSGDPTRWEAPTLDSAVVAGFQDIGTLPPMEYPADNPYSDAKKELGKKLFFDPRLSRSQQIACASCHDSQLGWGDGRTVSFGHNRQVGTRNSLTLLNIGYHKIFFWDGRAASLEQQVLMPIKDPVEMHSSETISVRNIRKAKGYKPLFKAAFGDEQINIERIQKAIATYERTIVSKRSKFDRFIAGEKKIFSDQEVIGLHLFRTKARCINCHNTPLFSNQQFHNVGLSYYGRVFEDLGRYNITHQREDVGRFKTPSLREVTHTAPYMHNGLMPHLEGIMEMYNVGMPRPKPNEKQKNDPLFPTTDELLKPLALSKEEREALIAFLHTLSSTPVRERIPELPE
ncbi:MAG: cytochrome c peroxidase [Capnocytophaga sp.]|nr:cytochrome c peroxidase [Capnocytophaga sp.]